MRFIAAKTRQAVNDPGEGDWWQNRNATKPEKAGKNEGGRVVPAAAFSLE